MERLKEELTQRRERRRRGTSRIILPPFVVVTSNRPFIRIPETSSNYSDLLSDKSVNGSIETRLQNSPTRSRTIRNELVRNEPFRVQSSLEPTRPVTRIERIIPSTESVATELTGISAQLSQPTVIREGDTEAGTLIIPTTIASPVASVATNTGMLTPERINSPDIEGDLSNQAQSDDDMDIVQDEELSIQSPVNNEKESTPSVQERERFATAEIKENIPIVDEPEKPVEDPGLTNNDTEGYEAMIDEPENPVEEPGLATNDTEEYEAMVVEPENPVDEHELTNNEIEGHEAMMVDTENRAEEPELTNNETEGHEAMIVEPENRAEEPELTNNETEGHEAMMAETENRAEDPGLINNQTEGHEAMVVETENRVEEPVLTNNSMDGFEAITYEDTYDPNDNNFDYFEQEPEREREQEREQEIEPESERERELDEADENGITERDIIAEIEEMELSFKKTPKYTRLGKYGLLHIEALEKACYGPMQDARNSMEDPLVRSAIEEFYFRLMNTFEGYSIDYQEYVDSSASIYYLHRLSEKMNKERLVAVASTMEIEKRIEDVNKQIELLQSKIETSDTIEDYLSKVRQLAQHSNDDRE